MAVVGLRRSLQVRAPLDEATFTTRLRVAGLEPSPTSWTPVASADLPGNRSWRLIETRRGDGPPCPVLAVVGPEGTTASADPCPPGTDTAAVADVIATVLTGSAVPAGGDVFSGAPGRRHPVVVRRPDPA